MLRIKKQVLLLILLSIMLFSCLAVANASSILTASVDTEGNSVQIKGTTIPDTYVSVLVTRNSDGDKRYADQTRSGENGSYAFEFELDSGDYTAAVASNGIYRQHNISIRKAGAATVTVRVEGAENTLLPLTEVTILDGETTLLQAIQDALDQNSVAYQMAGNLIDSIAGESGWQWLVNNRSGMTLPGTPLNGGDEIVLVDDQIWNPVITKLSVSKDRVTVGEEFTVTLQKAEGTSLSPAANQPVTFAGVEKTTDQEGRVTFTAQKEGTYEITAGTTGNLIRPVPVLMTVSKTGGPGGGPAIALTVDEPAGGISWQRPLTISAGAETQVSWQAEIRDQTNTVIAARTGEGTQFTWTWQPNNQLPVAVQYTVAVTAKDAQNNTATEECAFSVYNYPLQFTGVQTTDFNGNPKESFSPGDACAFKATLRNLDETDQSVLNIVQVKAADDTVLFLGFAQGHVYALDRGNIGTGLRLGSEFTEGSYTVEAFAWNRWPSQGTAEAPFAALAGKEEGSFNVGS